MKAKIKDVLFYVTAGLLCMGLINFSIGWPAAYAQTETFDPNDDCGYKRHTLRCGDIVFPDGSPPPPNGGQGSIAVIGCSNSAQSAQGYRNESTLDLLMNPQQTAGGRLGQMVLKQWAENTGDGWTLVNAREPTGGYDSAWFQLCLSHRDHNGDTMTATHQAQLTAVINKLGSQYGIPANKITLSPLQKYPAGHVCSIAGAGIFELGQKIAAWSQANLNTTIGPELHIDRLRDLDPDDLCHLSGSGIRKVGQQLVEWFD